MTAFFLCSVLLNSFYRPSPHPQGRRDLKRPMLEFILILFFHLHRRPPTLVSNTASADGCLEQVLAMSSSSWIPGKVSFGRTSFESILDCWPPFTILFRASLPSLIIIHLVVILTDLPSLPRLVVFSRFPPATHPFSPFCDPQERKSF